MAKIVLFLLVFVILSTKSVHCQRDHHGWVCDTYLISTIIILSVIIMLTIVIICIMGLLLYKERSFKRKIEFSPPPNNIRRNEYIRQDSDIHSPSSYKAQLTRNESVISILSENDNTENIVQVEIPSDTVYKRETTLEKANPVAQKPKVEPIIRREQMDALVKDILSKTKRKDTDSLSDLNKLITEGRNTNNENNINEAPTHATNNTAQKESKLEDQYDRLPTPVPLQDDADNETDDLYDVIPNNKKINTFNCIVSDNGYLLPISSDTECTSSNDYINARKSPSKSNANVSTNSKMNDIKDLRYSTGKESSQAGKEKDKESVC
ncbi:hypothetical protein K1T71_009839 [Dendrolimus kikuchii]|uniref:Uncharacterized protein n=1 Tax=Dendrolimus kikuchii TaxID=765133 RepID=A0ACC1CT11_9NEOP|nr:hypothetical protein K1T71_009839 [Dendrolimus kikuchii]